MNLSVPSEGGSSEPACVYTALLGEYERLTEQPISHESGLRFICFTDDPYLRSDTWDVVLVDPRFPMDPIRSQREYKLLPHRFLSRYSASLYIDNSVLLKRPPEELLTQYLPDCDFALPGHSYRKTVLDEFFEVAKLGFDDPSRVFEQLNHYALSAPAVLEEVPYWGGMLLRRHGNPKLQQTLDLWLAHVYRYSRRDQLSLNACCNATGFVPKRLPLDNFSSEFHDWPVAPGRDRNRGSRSMAVSLVPVQLQLRKEISSHIETQERLSAEVESHRQTQERLNEEIDSHRHTQSLLDTEVGCHKYTRETLDQMRNSWTWQITEPLRRAWHIGRKLLT